jgi:hypothetical protein
LRTATRSVASFTLAVAASCAFAQIGILPATPVAGEPFVIQYQGFTGGSPSIVRSAAVFSDGQSVTLAVHADDAGFAVPGSYRVSRIVPGLNAGTYQLRLRLRNSYGGDIESLAGSVTVTPASAPATPLHRNLSGNWFNADEAGWGINVVQGDSGALFGVWLTYLPVYTASDSVRQNGMWLVMPEGRWLSPTEFRGLLYSTTGPSISRPFDAGAISATPVGYASLRFTSSGEAQFRAEAGVGLYPYFTKEESIRRFAF